jgi:transglutaminase-like putative cysteine protease
VRRPVRFAIVFLAALSFATASRAQFTQPSRDELQMTSDSKAPGAAAIYLYREEITDDRSHFVSLYARMKVLTEKGKDIATVTLPYQRGAETIAEIDGRTIHSDGSIVPLTAQPADLMDFKVKRLQENTVVFSLPDVQVGSILEYRLKIRTPGNRVSEPTWDVQTKEFARKEHFEFRVAADVRVSDRSGHEYSNVMWTGRLPSGIKGVYAFQNTYSLDVSDIPPIPNEEWMGPINTLLWTVHFYYTNSGDPDHYWGTVGKQWSSRIDEFTRPTPALAKFADGVFAPGVSDSEKARKLYDAVQKLDNARFSRYKTATELKKDKVKEIRNAEDVWRQQGGTDDQITLLYIALCRAAGLKAYPPGSSAAAAPFSTGITCRKDNSTIIWPSFPSMAARCSSILARNSAPLAH